MKGFERIQMTDDVEEDIIGVHKIFSKNNS